MKEIKKEHCKLNDIFTKCEYNEVDVGGYTVFVCSACGQTSIVKPESGDICPTCGKTII